jgi:hypothetical protein
MVETAHLSFKNKGPQDALGPIKGMEKAPENTPAGPKKCIISKN